MWKLRIKYIRGRCTGELQHRDKEMLFMYDEAVRYITDKIKMKPEIGIVLGSGLGDAFTVDDPV